MTSSAPRAPFRIVRVLYAPDGDGKRVSGRERAGAAPDLAGARAGLSQLRIDDSDAIADGLLAYEVRDAAGRRVDLSPAPAEAVPAL